MSRLTRLLAVCLLAIAAPSLLPARAAEPVIPRFWDTTERLPRPDVSAMPRLRFLTTTDFPPFNYLDGQGRVAGFHVDLARAICQQLGLLDRCEIQALPFGELEGALTRGDGEAVIAGLAVTPESRLTHSFSRPYLRFPARFVMPKAGAIAEPIDVNLAGKRVGVIAGSAHEALLRAWFPGMKAVAFDQPALLHAALRSGLLDAAFGDGMRLSFWLASADSEGCCRFAGGPYLAQDYLGSGLAIAAKPEDAMLASAFDYALRELHAKGVFAELYLRYFPVSFF